MEPSKIRQLAQYAEENGAHSKANMLRHFADEIELYEPVVEAVEAEQEQGEYDRQRVAQAIQEADEA